MCCNKNCKCIIPIIISLVLAIIIGALYTATVVTAPAILLYIILGLAAFFILMFLITTIAAKQIERYCVCNYGSCLIVGSLGAIISSAILLAITVTETLTAVIFGIISFFIIFAIIEFLLYVLCLIKANCICEK